MRGRPDWFGATSGATEQKYLRGGPRMREYLHRYGKRLSRWVPSEPNELAPEGEWGFDRSLVDDIVSLGARMTLRIIEIRFSEPESLGFVAASAYRLEHALMPCGPS